MKPDPKARPHPCWHPQRRSGCSSAEPYPPRGRRQPTTADGRRRKARPHPDGPEAENLGVWGRAPGKIAGPPRPGREGGGAQ